jgi:hypothetical protein
MSPSEWDSRPTALATRAIAFMDVAAIRSVVVTAFLALELVHVLAVIGPGLSSVAQNFLAVGVHEARSRCSFIW